MKLHPWLIQTYKHIIKQYEKKTAHHAILIKTQRGIGVSRLIWFISKWLLCLRPLGLNFCNECHGCKLMSANNHPDWHCFIAEKNNNFNVENVRIINEKIFQSSRQDGNKIVFLSDTEKLSESGINAFLKTLEEPPEKTWFFLINYNHFNLHSTLNSRCLTYKLFIPSEKESLKWLKEEKLIKNRSHLTALRVNEGSPIHAKKFINSDELWMERINFYKYLFDAFKKQNLLKILPILNKKNIIFKINWICFLLLDSIKFNCKQTDYLTNFDHIEIIQFLSYNHTNIILDTSIRKWMLCRYRLLNISGINQELLLLEQLLSWEKLLKFIYTD